MNPMPHLLALLDLGWHVNLHRLQDRAGAGGKPVDPEHPIVYTVVLWRFDASGAHAVAGRGRHGILRQSMLDAAHQALAHARGLGCAALAGELEAFVARLEAPPVEGVCECWRPQNHGHERECPHWTEADDA